MKNRIISAALLALMCLGTACKKILDINDNPNASTTVTNDMLLAGTLLSSARLENGAINEIGSFYGGYWGKAYDASGSATGSAATALDLITSYNIIDNFATDIWEKSYTYIYNYTLLQQQAQGQAPFYAGIAKIMKGMHYLRLVDHYNNIPFSQAANPLITQPVYDNAETVYAGALDLITSGIADIKSAGATTIPSSADIFFKGNAASWIRFANTLKLRALLQQSQLSNKTSYINTEIAKIVAEGSSFSNADVLANPGFTTQSDNQQNPFYTTYYRTAQGTIPAMFNAIRPTRFLLASYDAVNDPRKAAIYAEATNGGGYRGVLLGQNVADATQNATATSAFRGPNAGVIKTATSGALVLSLSESLFLQAEATQRGWLSGSTKSLYESAIQASFSYLGVASAAFTSYNAQAAVAFDDASASDKVSRIISQKWLALNSIAGASAWNDFRRLGLPQGMPLAISKTSAPKRLRYPSSEVSTNSAQVKAQGNIDGLVNKIFWNP